MDCEPVRSGDAPKRTAVPIVRELLAEGEVVAAHDISGVRIPDSRMACEVTQLVRDTESDLLFYHSTRVYFWGALTEMRKRLMFDPELLYAGAMFHDVGLTQSYRSRDFASQWMVPMLRSIF